MFVFSGEDSIFGAMLSAVARLPFRICYCFQQHRMVSNFPSRIGSPIYLPSITSSLRVIYSSYIRRIRTYEYTTSHCVSP